MRLYVKGDEAMVLTYDWLVYCYDHKESDFAKSVKALLESGEDGELYYSNTHKITFYGKEQYVTVKRWNRGLDLIKLVEAKLTYKAVRGMMTMELEGVTWDDIEWL